MYGRIASMRCRIFFRIGELDLGGVAHAFGLIRLPLMPELKARKAAGTLVYNEEAGIDFRAIGYKDRVKEKARLAKVESERMEKAAQQKENQEEGGGSGVVAMTIAIAATTRMPVEQSKATSAKRSEESSWAMDPPGLHRRRKRASRNCDERNVRVNALSQNQTASAAQGRGGESAQSQAQSKGQRKSKGKDAEEDDEERKIGTRNIGNLKSRSVSSSSSSSSSSSVVAAIAATMMGKTIAMPVDKEVWLKTRSRSLFSNDPGRTAKVFAILSIGFVHCFSLSSLSAHQSVLRSEHGADSVFIVDREYE